MSQPPTVTEADVRRVADVVSDRLRHLPPARLEPLEGDVRARLDELAALALAAERLDPRPLPPVSPRAFGDQVSVLTHDLLAACRATKSAGASDPVARAHSLLVSLRRLLP